MFLDERKGTFTPHIVDRSAVSGREIEFQVCPGKGVPISKIAESLYPSAEHDSFLLGKYRVAVAAHSTSERILKQASSGGVMIAIATYLIEMGIVQGVTATRFTYGGLGPRTEVYIARTLEELLESQGSKYCPTTTNELVHKCVKEGGQYLFVGTPCQVAALRLAASQTPALGDVFPCTMANFCGGYRDFRYLDRLLGIHGLDPGDVAFFRFRGEGQPGSLLARTSNGKSIKLAYPDYVGHCAIPKQKRCTYCIDATGELADFACGDAWLGRYQKDRKPWSIILARSSFAEQTIREMDLERLLVTEPITGEDVCDSQKLNLESKKFRQRRRMLISRLLGITIPQWDVEMPNGGRGYLYELYAIFGKTSVGRKIQTLLRPLMRFLRRRRVSSSQSSQPMDF